MFDRGERYTADRFMIYDDLQLLHDISFVRILQKNSP